MSDFVTFSELFRIARDEALSRNSLLTRDIIERDGTDANVIIASAAAVGDEVVGQLAEVEASLYLDSAKGQKLDRLVFDRFGLTRKPAAPARGSVEFRTTAPAPSAFTIPINLRLQTADGRQYITTVAATFPAGGVGPLVVGVRSVIAGVSQQARVGTITSIIGTITSAPGDLRATNTLATSGADDEEGDDSLRDRARQFFTTARRGTLAAIRAAALAVPGVRTATAFEILDVLGRPAKEVQLVVADAFTDSLISITPTPALYQTQSQVLATTVFNSLDDVRAAGIFVKVVVASVVLQGAQLGLRFVAGFNVEDVALRARGSVVGHINALSPGQTLKITDLLDKLRSIAGLIVTGQEIISPSGDVVAQTLQVLRTTLALVTATSLQPLGALQGTTNPDSVTVST